MKHYIAVFAFAASGLLEGQTIINGSRQIDGTLSVLGTGSTLDVHAASHSSPAPAGLTASKPATCAVGEMYFATDATAGQNWFYCTATNTWTAQLAGGGGTVSNVFGRTGAVTAQSGDYTAAQVTNAAQLNASNTFTAGTQNFSGAAHTLPAVTGLTASKPGSCTVGEMYFATDATAGQNWYYCTAANTWTQQVNTVGLADPGGNGIVKRTALNVTADAAASDVIGLFSSCSGTQYLGADGACHTAGGGSTVTENTYIPFIAQYSTGTNAACGPGCVSDSGNNTNSGPDPFHGVGYGIPAYEFYNSSSADYIYITWMLHQNWTGNVNVVLTAISGSATGNAYLKVATWCSTSTPLNAPSFNTDSTSTVAGSSSYKPLALTLSNISMSGCSAGNSIVFRVGRDHSNATDTMAGPIYLLGMQIQWQHT